MQQIVVGERAPDFELTDQAGSEWSLGGNRGRIVLLLFYPGNETLVCTKQLCSLRDNWAKYAETTAEIVGVSVRPNEENGSFASKYRLPLTILSDPDREVPRAYANHWLFPLNFMRRLTVVDAEGSSEITRRCCEPFVQTITTYFCVYTPLASTASRPNIINSANACVQFCSASSSAPLGMKHPQKEDMNRAEQDRVASTVG